MLLSQLATDPARLWHEKEAEGEFRASFDPASAVVNVSTTNM